MTDADKLPKCGFDPDEEPSKTVEAVRERLGQYGCFEVLEEVEHIIKSLRDGLRQWRGWQTSGELPKSQRKLGEVQHSAIELIISMLRMNDLFVHTLLGYAIDDDEDPE